MISEMLLMNGIITHKFYIFMIILNLDVYIVRAYLHSITRYINIFGEIVKDISSHKTKFL